ncbi:MAG: transcriptional regulator, MerR family [Rickettsiaceae bacterium]|jgi:DNA-binding transcriptional MerR regulator|nr:transcriptional regulator, MerR family [Rickettsiaceae bacterium]
MEESDKKRSIGEVVKELEVDAQTIRFWESKFPQINPEIGKGNRRHYSDRDMEVFVAIKTLLEEGHDIDHLKELLDQELKETSEEVDQDEADDISSDELETKDSLNKIIARIEVNLKKLDQIISDIA